MLDVNAVSALSVLVFVACQGYAFGDTDAMIAQAYWNALF